MIALDVQRTEVEQVRERVGQGTGQVVIGKIDAGDQTQEAGHTVPGADVAVLQPVRLGRPVCATGAVVERDQCLTWQIERTAAKGAGRDVGVCRSATRNVSTFRSLRERKNALLFDSGHGRCSESTSNSKKCENGKQYND